MSSSWTSRAESSTVRSHICPVFRGLIFPAIRFCLFSGLIFTLSACDLSALTGSSSNPPATAVPAPPGGGDRPPEPGQLGRATGADGLPTLRAPMGVNVSVDTLFAEDIKDPVERIKRVENAVVEMRRDFDQTLPAIKRLVAVEKDMQTLMVQLESLLSGNADDATVSGAMAPQNSPDSSTLEGVEEQVDTSLPTSGIPTPEVQVEKISAVPQDSRSVNTVSSAAAVSAPVSPVPAAAPVQPAIQAPISAPAQQPAPSPVSAPAAAIPSPVAQQPAIQAPIALPAPAPAPAVAPVPVIPAPVAAPTAAPAPVPAAPIQAQTPVMSAPAPAVVTMSPDVVISRFDQQSRCRFVI